MQDLSQLVFLNLEELPLQEEACLDTKADVDADAHDQDLVDSVPDHLSCFAISVFEGTDTHVTVIKV